MPIKVALAGRPRAGGAALDVRPRSRDAAISRVSRLRLWFLDEPPETGAVVPLPATIGDGSTGYLLALVSPERLMRMLQKVFDESGLLRRYGIRSHLGVAPRASVHGRRSAASDASVDYEPAESTTGLFGGNSNWRGPVWFPLNVLLVEALRDYDSTGSPDDVTVEYPDRVRHVAHPRRSRRRHLPPADLALPPRAGRAATGHGCVRPALDGSAMEATTCPFHEYFHGDTGKGLGASHQTGWTALVAHLILTGGKVNASAAARPTLVGDSPQS